MRNSLTDFAIVVILAVGIVLAFRKEDEGDDPTWEERWRELSPADRSRIARAARSGAALLIAGMVVDSPVFVVGGTIFFIRGLWLLRSTSDLVATSAKRSPAITTSEEIPRCPSY